MLLKKLFANIIIPKRILTVQGATGYKSGSSAYQSAGDSVAEHYTDRSSLAALYKSSKDDAQMS